MSSNEMEIGLPEKLELIQHGTHIELVQRWFGSKIVVITLFAVIWDAILINWYLVAGSNRDPMAFYFPLLHVAAGIGISYYALAGWFNRTHILISSAAIEARSGPLPWFGNKKIQSTDIKQLYAKENISESRRGTSVTYEVHVITNDGRNLKLLGGLDTSEQALYIEQQIEKYLGIENKPVRGEIGSISAS